MMTRLLRCSLAFLVVLALGSLKLWCQTNTTSLSGTVTDATGASLPGASVSISNSATGAVLTTETKSKGEFSI